jgi:hypothetical protein
VEDVTVATLIKRFAYRDFKGLDSEKQKDLVLAAQAVAKQKRASDGTFVAAEMRDSAELGIIEAEFLHASEVELPRLNTFQFHVTLTDTLDALCAADVKNPKPNTLYCLWDFKAFEPNCDAQLFGPLGRKNQDHKTCILHCVFVNFQIWAGERKVENYIFGKLVLGMRHVVFGSFNLFLLGFLLVGFHKRIQNYSVGPKFARADVFNWVLAFVF